MEDLGQAPWPDRLYSTPRARPVYVIGNHNGIGPCGSRYDEGSIIQKTLLGLGLTAQLVNPEIGFNTPAVRAGDRVVVATQPACHNAVLEEFVTMHRCAAMVWRPGWAQLGLVKGLLAKGGIGVIHLCLEKASRLTGRSSLADSAQLVNESCPRAVVIVSNASGAAACQYCRVTRVDSNCAHSASPHDGKGAAFLGAFLVEFFRSGDLPLSLTLGHDLASAAAAGRWP